MAGCNYAEPIQASEAHLLRALALGNANAHCKGYLAFQTPKYIASGIYC